jgi:hypothetical protein
MFLHCLQSNSDLKYDHQSINTCLLFYSLRVLNEFLVCQVEVFKLWCVCLRGGGNG